MESANQHLQEVELLHDVASSELADLCGLANAAHGRMVEVVADALAEDAWDGAGILSPKHWVTWQTGMTDVMAADVVRLAKRRHELTATVTALRDGRISLASAGLIARYVPTDYELGVLDLALILTVRQLRRSVTRYHFDLDRPEPPPPPPAPADPSGDSSDSGTDDGPSPDPEGGSDDDGADDGSDDTDAGAGGPEPDGMQGGRPLTGGRPIEERRDLSCGTDDHDTFWLNAHLPADQGEVVRAALRARRDDLYREACQGLPEDAPRPTVTLADALVSLAEGALAGGAAAMPGNDRYLVHAHLTASPGGGNDLQLHLGATLPHHLRQLYTCDCRIRPVLETDGVPVNVGRLQHIVSRRVRRLIEHRDGGCTVPGCPRTSGLEIHHIIHWEDGGLTTTSNLVTLCRQHHRAHHLGLLGITGNADHPHHTPEGVTFTNRWGHRLQPGAAPRPPATGHSLGEVAARAGLSPDPYQHALGERLDHSAVTFNTNEAMTRSYRNRSSEGRAGSGDRQPLLASGP